MWGQIIFCKSTKRIRKRNIHCKSQKERKATRKRVENAAAILMICAVGDVRAGDRKKIPRDIKRERKSQNSREQFEGMNTIARCNAASPSFKVSTKTVYGWKEIWQIIIYMANNQIFHLEYELDGNLKKQELEETQLFKLQE
jgi:hypothetical protein